MLMLRKRSGLRKAAGRLRPHWIAVTVVVVRTALGIAYSAAIPIWEAYDEPGHYQYVRYIAARHALPLAGDPYAQEISERIQPPLYYMLGALSIGWIDTSDDLRPTLNPFFPAGTGGINHAIHPDSEGFPYRGTVLAVHLLRLLSVAISLVGVVSTYLIGLTIAPGRKDIAIGAMAIHAFWPQFLFNGSVITNDVLASALGSVITLVLMQMIKGKSSAPQVLILGFSFGLGLLSKLNTIALLPIALLVVVKEAITKTRGSALRHKARWAGWALAGCLALLLAWRVLERTPYLVIPVVGYEDSPLSEGVVSGVSDMLVRLDLSTLRRAVAHTLNTFFATFGWGNLAVEPILYNVYAVLLAVASIGLVLFTIRRRSEPSLTYLAVLLTEFLAALSLPLLLVAAHGQEVSFAPGRYLLPGISAFSVLLCVGWDEASRYGKSSALPTIAVAALLLFAIVIPFRYIMPAYARPPLLSRADVQGLEHQISLSFGERIRLLGYELDRNELEPRQGVRITLYWEALTEMEQDYTICVRLLGPNGESDGADCTYPGRGNYATSLWKSGDIFRDAYYGRIPRDFPAPSFASVNVAIFRYPEEEYLHVIDPQGTQLGQSATFGRVKVASSEEFIPDITRLVSYDLGSTVALMGYEVGGTPSPGSALRLRLYWRSLAPTDEDYTVFVHFRDGDGRLWAQHDGQPRNNYYPTSLWDEGEIVEDEHEFTLPPDIPSGGYEIRVGMYSLDTLRRLPVFDDQGNRQQGDAIILEEVVTAP